MPICSGNTSDRKFHFQTYPIRARLCMRQCTAPATSTGRAAAASERPCPIQSLLASCARSRHAPAESSMPAAPSPFRLPLVAILRGVTPDQAPAHFDALLDQGYDAIEIPLNSPDWATSIGQAVRAHGERAWIGGGTVLRPAQVDQLRELGARFIVTPNTNPALIRHAADAGLQVLAGFATASEAFAALDAGASMLKLFPAATYGPGHIRALRA